jgi:SAM-dependent methyltransferase
MKRKKILPLLAESVVKRVMDFRVITNHPVALDSLDHTHPCGAMRDNSANLWFNENLENWMSQNLAPRNRPYRAMDIGCAGGAFVKSLLERGWDAVGIEGSDYNAKNQQFNWPELHEKNLFTADATKPFCVMNGIGSFARFDVVTAWEVMEHISEKDLVHFLAAIDAHLEPDGLFICSISSVDSPHEYNGERVELHTNIKGHYEWVETMKKYGFLSRLDISLAIGRERVRYGTMTHIGPQIPENATDYGDDFLCGNYVFTKEPA